MAEVDDCRKRFEDAMDDDLNTAEAMGALFDLVYAANTSVTTDTSKKAVQHALDALYQLTDILGLLAKKPGELPEDVQALADQRVQARQQKNWAQSDALRAQLNEMGYTVEDTAAGQKIVKTC